MDTEREQVFSINARLFFYIETVYSVMAEGTIASLFVCLFVCWVICFQVASILAAYLRYTRLRDPNHPRLANC